MMKRKLIVTAAVLALSSLTTGCGQQATSGVPLSRVSQTTTAKSTTSQTAQNGSSVGKSFDSAATASTQTTTTSQSTSTATQADEADTAQSELDTSKLLGIEVVGKEVVRKVLILKKLSVTVQVTNHNPTETLSGEVKVDFYGTKGLLKKETVKVETLTQSVQGLAPGKSVELTLVSTKSAVDAEATVFTVLSSATAE